jgi:hypothetical protein
MARYKDTSSNEGVKIADNAVGLKETEKALLVKLDDDREIWLPKSVLTEDSEIQNEFGMGELRVKQWFAEKEGLG